MKKVQVRAPVRIDFAGGWTDVPPYCDEVGGTVVNATLQRYVTGTFMIDNEDKIKVEYKSDIPISSGLGTSATMNVVWLKLIKKELEWHDIAEKSFWLEKLLGIAGGRQDQYASAAGGINYMTFNLNQTEVHPIKMAPEVVAELENRICIAYTGKARLSSNIVMTVMKNYKSNNPKTVRGLSMINKAAQQIKPALEKGDFDEIARQLNQNWEGQKMLSDEVTNPQIEGLFEKAFANGAVAGKAGGAGGGGSLIFLGDREKIEAALKSECQIIPCKFDFKGLTITEDSFH